MSISVKQKELHAKNVEESTSRMVSLSEKPQAYLQEQDNQPIYQSPSSIVETADTLIPNSFQRNSPNWTRYIYDGLQLSLIHI